MEDTSGDCMQTFIMISSVAVHVDCRNVFLLSRRFVRILILSSTSRCNSWMGTTLAMHYIACGAVNFHHGCERV